MDGVIIIFIVIGFLGFILLVASIVMFIFWRRRKLVFTNFLSDTGQWERESWMPNKIQKEFTYDGQTYKYDIRKCTRDRLNRPIAHYYKGNPEQQIFNYALGNKNITIDTLTITNKDFQALMLSKVIRDIFQDEELMNWLMAILVVSIIIGIAVCIVVATHNPKVTLADNNVTASIITNACRNAITNGRV